MKIGIVTFHTAYNYGAVLQAYALQSYLAKIGHETFIINCDYKLDGPLTRRHHREWIRRGGSSLAAKVRRGILAPLFQDFKKKHLAMGKYEYSNYLELQQKPPVANAYICGSDQIWHPNHFNSRDEGAIWLDFGIDSTKRISYAASFGVSELDDPIYARWATYAIRFCAISVREREAVDIMKKMGREDAVWVPDPVLLLNPSDYDCVAVHSGKYDTPSIFSYQIAAEWEQFDRTRDVAHEIFGVPCYDCRPSSIKHNLFHGGRISVGGWISRMRNSRFVITSSFHGVAFSLLYHRPFIVLLRSAKHPGVARFTSLLKAVGLQHRVVSPFDQTQVMRLCHEEIDWDRVDEKISQARETGKQFLHDALL